MRHNDKRKFTRSRECCITYPFKTLSITSIGIVAIADSTIKGFTKVIVSGQTEPHEAQLINEPPLCHDIVQQKGNAVHADGQNTTINHPQCVHSRYNLQTNQNPSTKLKNSLLFLLAILFVVPIVCGKDVHVFPEVGAIAEWCGDVAVQSSSAIFSMVLSRDAFF